MAIDTSQLPIVVKLYKHLVKEVDICHQVLESVEFGSVNLPRFQARCSFAKELQEQIKQLIKQMDSEEGLDTDDVLDDDIFEIFDSTKD